MAGAGDGGRAEDGEVDDERVTLDHAHRVTDHLAQGPQWACGPRLGEHYHRHSSGIAIEKLPDDIPAFSARAIEQFAAQERS